MKTIGIVGGIAWPSTIVYYRTINSSWHGDWAAQDCTAQSS